MENQAFQKDLMSMYNEAVAIINKLIPYGNETIFYDQLACITKTKVIRYRMRCETNIYSTVEFSELFFKKCYVKFNVFSLINLEKKLINNKMVVPMCLNSHIFNNVATVANYFDTTRKNYVKAPIENIANILLCKHQLNSMVISPITDIFNNRIVYFAENKYVYYDTALSNIVMHNNHALKWYPTDCNYRNIDLKDLIMHGSVCNCLKLID